MSEVIASKPSLNSYGSHSGRNYLAIRERREVTESHQNTAAAVHALEEPATDVEDRREVTESHQNTAAAVHPLEEQEADVEDRKEVIESHQNTAAAVHLFDELLVLEDRREVTEPNQNTAVAANPLEEVAEIDITDEGEGEEFIHSIGQKNTNMTYGINHGEPLMNSNETILSNIFKPYFSNNSEDLIERPYPRLYEIPAIILIRLQEFKKQINDYLEMREKFANTSDINKLFLEKESLFEELNNTSDYKSSPEIVLPDSNPLPNYSSETDFSHDHINRNVGDLNTKAEETPMFIGGQWYFPNNDTASPTNLTQEESVPKQLLLSSASSHVLDPSTVEDAGHSVEILSEDIIFSSAELPIDHHSVADSLVTEDVESDLSVIKQDKLEDSAFGDIVSSDDKVLSSEFISSNDDSTFDDSMVAPDVQPVQSGMNSSEKTLIVETTFDVKSFPDTYVVEPQKESDLISADL
ncbi:hypothetical protein J6590_008258 [Homalodisca vitripennis]|nr:hypothetical protein J6590_008258 [Homalodisca vitripennis]